MSFGLSLGMSHSIEMIQLYLSDNWSLLNAFEQQGTNPLLFPAVQMDVSGLGLEERLKKVEEDNELFRYEYQQGEIEKDGRTFPRYFKIPLFRNTNVDPDNVKIKIGKEEFDRAKLALRGVGSFQRIARAIPYHGLFDNIKGFVEENNGSLDEVVVVGVDRGGRLPSYIVREVLGKDNGFSLKVCQQGGGLDEGRLKEMADNGAFRDKYVLFVDSTVDSGRQIDVLKRYFDGGEWKDKLGHKNWGIVGSNENGVNLYNHRNVCWGVDPDYTFEDDPVLMGVDYGEVSTRTKEKPTEASEAIREALLDVPRGQGLDFSKIDGILRARVLAHPAVARVLKSKNWKNSARESEEISDWGVSGLEGVVNGEGDRGKLLVIGNGRETDVGEKAVEYLVNSLSPVYDVIVGTPKGNPGILSERFSNIREGSAQLYQLIEMADSLEDKNMYGNPIVFYGDKKSELRELLVNSADAVLVLGGGKGTLNEMILAHHSKKPVYMVDGHGRIGRYIQKSEYKNSNFVNVVGSLPEAVEGLRERK
jgi:hypoxanthine phosphoribosyltransferase